MGNGLNIEYIIGYLDFLLRCNSSNLVRIENYYQRRFSKRILTVDNSENMKSSAPRNRIKKIGKTFKQFIQNWCLALF